MTIKIKTITALGKDLCVKRIVCKEEDFKKWSNGETVYLDNAECFATYNMEPVSIEEEESVKEKYNEGLPLEKARYAYARAKYTETYPGTVPFDELSDEEKKEYYLDEVLKPYRPVMFYEWLDTGNIADRVEMNGTTYVLFSL